MKIAYAPYELEARGTVNAVSTCVKRKGALLKVAFEPTHIGYADCHPSPELGDLLLHQQLEALSQGRLTSLSRCSLAFARLDAKARSQKQQVLEGRPIPQSHFLVTQLLEWTPHHVKRVIQLGYTHVKVKVGRQVEQEGKHLVELFSRSPLQLRLDFNERLTPSLFRSFLHQIKALREYIDFIEDPFPFDAQKWATIQQEGWTLACDRHAQAACNLPDSAKVLIIKPALLLVEEWQKGKDQKKIVTSYLGHPIEQVAAAYAASEVDASSRFVHGLLSHGVYSPTPFSLQLNWQGPQFTVPAGYGFGFDQELKQLEWINL